MVKTVALGDIFNEQDVRKILRLCAEHESDPVGFLVDCIESLVIRPKLSKINQVTRQQNDARYWAYLMLSVLSRINEITAEQPIEYATTLH